MLVCLGSALAIIVSAYGFRDVLGTPAVALDPSRIAAQVISGIGFLGAGTIIFLRREIVRGLTTAAGLWAVAAIGLAIGSGLYIPGVVATAIVLLILAGLKPLERRLFHKRSMKEFNITVERETFDMRDLESILSDVAVSYGAITIYPEKSATEDLLQVRLKSGLNMKNATLLLERLRVCPGVKKASTGDIDLS
jgi:putative Mg2+ transporter-C (MgtC) family protein